MTRWLLLAGILSLQLGCAANPPNQKDSQPEATADQKHAENQVTPEQIKRPTDPTAAKTPSEQATTERAVENKPQTQTELSGEVLYYLLSAEIAAQRGQIGLSSALYTKAAEVTRDPRIAQQATRTAYYARNDKRAIAAATLWNELEPENLEARQVLAAMLVRAGKTEDAVKHFEYVLSNGKYSERQGFLLISSLLSKEKDKQTALEVMRKLISKRKNNPNGLYAYSQLAYLMGSLDVAASSIKKVIELQPEWTEAYILQTNILVRQGYKAQAIEVLRETVAAQPDNAKLRMFYARNLVDAKQFDEAIIQFSQLTDDETSEHEARYALGLLTLQMNKPEQAQEHFSRLLEDQKRIPESQYYLAQSYELQNELDDAVKWYKKISDIHYRFEAELRIAIILAKQGDLKGARLLLQNISPDSLDKEMRVYLAEGEMLNHAKQYEEALELYNEALQQLPDNNRLLYARALTAEKLDKVDMAVTDLENIVQREPDNAQALNALGYTLVDKTRQIEQGFSYIKKALKLAPDDPSILDSMGWAYYRMGQHAEALNYLKRAFAELKDAEVAAHLGEVLWVAGEREAAQDVWKSALQQTPNDDLLLNVIQKFSK